MTFGNNNGGNTGSRGPSVNTNLDTYFSDTCCMSIGCWNGDRITFKFMPAIGKTDNGFTKYDKDNRINTSVKLSKIATLVHLYRRKLYPILEGDKPKEEVLPFGIMLQSSKVGNCIISISYQKDETGEYSTFLHFARNVADDGKCDPSNIITLKFQKIDGLEDINFQNGTASQTKEEGEFISFIDNLKNAVLMKGMVGHSVRYSNSFSSGGNNSGGNSSGYNGASVDFNPSDMMGM